MKTVTKNCMFEETDKITCFFDDDESILLLSEQNRIHSTARERLSNQDAADFCVEILQELFKDADFKRETLARHGVKPAEPKQPEWVEAEGEIKVGDWVKCVDANSRDGEIEEGKVYQTSDVWIGTGTTDGKLFVKLDGSQVIKYTPFLASRFVKVIQK